MSRSPTPKSTVAQGLKGSRGRRGRWAAVLAAALLLSADAPAVKLSGDDAAAGLSLGVAAAEAAPPRRTRAKPATKSLAPSPPAGKLAKSAKPAKSAKLRRGEARVIFGATGVVRSMDPRGRRAEPLTLEEDTARRIEELLRGPLRVGTTAIYVADARTGQPVFAVHPDDALNPASNVKLLSTAAAIEILGPEFRYQTRVIGSVPHRNVVRGDVYLLGSFDPTLGGAAMEQLAAELAAAGISRIEGDVIVSDSPTRDAVYRALLPVEITAPAAAGAPPLVTLPVGYDFVTPVVTATVVTGKKARRTRLTYAEKLSPSETGAERLQLTIGGTIGAGKTHTHWLWVRDRGRHSAHLLRAALAAQGVAIAGDVHKAELSAYLFDRIRGGDLPVVLARHQSAPLAEIVASVNKRSINWLADRVIMTAAALKYHELPSMDRAVDAMYDWLSRRLRVDKDDVVLDTGSGLSRQTQLSARNIAEVLRVAGGFVDKQEHDPLHRLWLDSLAFADGSVRDGTLRGRFRGGLVGRLRGKTGTLSTSIALSGVLEADPERPLVFSIVTNGSSPLPKGRVRAGHDRIIALLGQYLTKRPGSMAPPAQLAARPAGPAMPAPAMPSRSIAKPAAGKGAAAAAAAAPPEELGIEGNTREVLETLEDTSDSAIEKALENEISGDVGAPL